MMSYIHDVINKKRPRWDTPVSFYFILKNRFKHALEATGSVSILLYLNFQTIFSHGIP